MSELKENSDLVKSHIDKLFSNLQKSWNVRGRIFIATILISVLLIGISSGTLSDIDNISAAGIKVKVSISVLVSAAIFSITILYGALASIDLHSDRLRDEIIRLYKSLGYSDKGLLERSRTPLEGPNIIQSAIHRLDWSIKDKFRIIFINDILVAIIAIASFIIIPISSQIVGSIWLITQFGWHYLAVAGSIICVLATLLVIVSSLMKTR